MNIIYEHNEIRNKYNRWKWHIRQGVNLDNILKYTEQSEAKILKFKKKTCFHNNRSQYIFPFPCVTAKFPMLSLSEKRKSQIPSFLQCHGHPAASFLIPTLISFGLGKQVDLHWPTIIWRLYLYHTWQIFIQVTKLSVFGKLWVDTEYFAPMKILIDLTDLSDLIIYEISSSHVSEQLTKKFSLSH